MFPHWSAEAAVASVSAGEAECAAGFYLISHETGANVLNAPNRHRAVGFLQAQPNEKQRGTQNMVYASANSSKTAPTWRGSACHYPLARL